MSSAESLNNSGWQTVPQGVPIKSTDEDEPGATI